MYFDCVSIIRVGNKCSLHYKPLRNFGCSSSCKVGLALQSSNIKLLFDNVLH